VQLGVNVPNFGPGTTPAVLRRWAQILDDLSQLRLLGAGTVVLDPFNGDPDETRHPEAAWHALATISARVRDLGERP
jgi:hypothetical protein